MAVLVLLTGCNTEVPKPPEPQLRYDVQFWNATGAPVDNVVIFDGPKEMSSGVLPEGVSKYMTAQETLLSGNEMRLEYVEVLSSGEKPKRIVAIPPLNEDYNGKAIIIKILPEQRVDCFVADETIVY